MQDFYNFFVQNKFIYQTLLVLFITFLALFLSKIIFYKIGFVDKPNKRSNHKTPIALGGGMIIIPLIILFSKILGFSWPVHVLFSLFILLLVSIIDDVRNINPLIRLLFHFLAVGTYVFFTITPLLDMLISDNIILLLITLIILILGTTWFINAFNFMDGINGITSVQVISISLILLIFNFFLEKEINYLLVTIFLVMSVFCYFNWTPSSIFLGDSGSIPLGFLIIFTLTEIALQGYWMAPSILSLYYMMDTSITLLNRIIKKKKFWRSHSEHFYQQAIRNGLSHSDISKKIIVINMGLFVLSFFSLIYKNNICFLILGIIWCSIFIYLFSDNKKVKNEKFF